MPTTTLDGDLPGPFFSKLMCFFNVYSPSLHWQSRRKMSPITSSTATTCRYRTPKIHPYEQQKTPPDTMRSGMAAHRNCATKGIASIQAIGSRSLRGPSTGFDLLRSAVAMLCPNRSFKVMMPARFVTCLVAARPLAKRTRIIRYVPFVLL
jgi:hypothetical protein